MRKKICILFFSMATLSVMAQEDLLAQLENSESNEPSLISSTFKGTRLINGHSVETRRTGALEFLISHRFGPINTGAYELWGLDQSNIRFGLEYAITDNLAVAVGRSSFGKSYDFYLKDKLISQGKSPVTVTILTALVITTEKGRQFDLVLSDRLSNVAQLLIARKFSQGLSLQLMPTYLHFNTIDPQQEQNSGFALGIGGRQKITSRVSLNLEYYPQLAKIEEDSFDSFAIGVDIETGGHVFQLHLTNARSMIEKGFIAENIADNFWEGDIRFGFNISRTFQLR